MLKKGILLLVSAALLTGAPAGCGSGTGGKSSSASTAKSTVDFGGATVTMWSNYQRDPRKSTTAKDDPNYDDNVAAWNQIEKEFNVKIDVKSDENFDTFKNNFNTAYSAGEVIADCIAGDMTYSYPTWIINNMLLPLNDWLDVYNKSGKAIWDPDISKTYEYNGKVYAVFPKNIDLPKYVLYFNQTLFSKYDQLKKYDLFQLVKSNQWTWDKFREVAMAGTIDTDGDGKANIMGVSTRAQPGSFLADGLVVSNGCYFVKRDGASATFDLESPAGMEALEFLYKLAWNDQCLGVTDVFDSRDGGRTEFQAGRVARFAGARGDRSLMNEMDDKVGMLPMPIGPKADGKYISDYPVTDFYGVVNGAKNPDKVAKLLEAIAGINFHGDTSAKTVKQVYESQVDQPESLDTIKIMLDARHKTAYYGYQVMIDDLLWSDYGLRAKTPPATFVAGIKPDITSKLNVLWTPISQ